VPYELGEVAALSFTAYDTNGAPANGAACTLTIARPDGTTDGPYSPAGVSGVYTYNYLAQVSGRHTYRWLATGTPGPGVGVGAFTDVLDVLASSAVGIFSLADAKAALNIPASTTTYDKKIMQYVRSITGFVEKYCGPVNVRQFTERVYAGGASIVLNKVPVVLAPLQVNQIISITPVLTYGLIYDNTVLSIDLRSGIVKHTAGLPFIYGPYDVTYSAGRIIPQDEILLGSEAILKHQWEQERGGAGQVGSYGTDDVTVMWGFAVPNRALDMLESQRAPAGIA
jgi:hypothetical protein